MMDLASFWRWGKGVEKAQAVAEALPCEVLQFRREDVGLHALRAVSTCNLARGAYGGWLPVVEPASGAFFIRGKWVRCQ